MSFGGAERVVVNLANHWAEKSWSIIIVTIAGRDQDFYLLLYHAIQRIILSPEAGRNGLSDVITSV